ncbi:geranylgeranyl pyrophosphate synthase [Brachybacterium avium]|uniref:Geranylgeranyl pyrophosphate synthase n=1 Tax=Brachybacterium avium TaxID=2017485 RepID=A0A220UG41_9MICO|nr:polyprenyl synthetase family protein [Brachybacterium avium]ASK66911.1 geranylgeranyl pyrophosphate synthase [Brachybacterium avium]
MPSADTSPVDARLHDLDERLATRLAEITRDELAERRRQLAVISPETAELADGLLDYLEGGKLLRPRFCFWGGVAALGPTEPTESQLRALARYGVAIELVQAAALMHDDVIDHSPMRRGRPALHVQASRCHRDGGLTGSADGFGTAVAIVLGDLALSWAEQIAATVEGEPRAVAAARCEFDALRTEVMAGQFLDILHQAGGYTSAADAEQAAFSVIRWKTVPYTVLRPVRIGAALMGGSEQALETLSEWSIEVGTAFQLRDDLLSVIGDQHETGKPIGGDILEGKRTVLLARTEAAASAEGRALLEAVVGRSGSSVQEIAAVHELMVSTGAVESVVQDVRQRAQHGRSLLADAAMLGPTGRAGLAALAALATEVEALTA